MIPVSIESDGDYEVIGEDTYSIVVINKEKRIVGRCSAIDSLKQSIKMMLSTERYEYQIYDDNYGIEINELCGLDHDYVLSEIQLRIEEALSIDERIIDTSDYEFYTKGNKILVSFKVNTIYGDFESEVELNV